MQKVRIGGWPKPPLTRSLGGAGCRLPRQRSRICSGLRKEEQKRTTKVQNKDNSSSRPQLPPYTWISTVHTNFLPLTARTRVSISRICHLRVPLLGWLLHVSMFSSSLLILGTSACSPLSKLLYCPPYRRGSEAICWLMPCCGLRLGRGDLCLVRRRR